MGRIITGISNVPGDYLKSWGRTIERVNTPQGRTQDVQGIKNIPTQIKNRDLGGFLRNPALEDTLNALDLFTLGAGTAEKMGSKKLAEVGAQDVVKTVAKNEGKTAASTIFKEAEHKAPNIIKKTAQLFEGDPQNRQLAMDYLAKNRTPVTTGPIKTDTELAMDALNKTRQGIGQKVTDAAQAAGDVLQPIKNKTEALFQKGTDIARQWINTREGFTNWRAGDIKRNPALTQFDKEGLNAIIDLQSGKNPERYKAIKDFTDGLFQLENKSGLLDEKQYRNNYLPQLWNNTPEEIQSVFKKVVGGKPGFSKGRLLEDYKTGIEAGLTPRYNTISDLLTSRFKSAQRALADKQFVENLVKTGNAKTLAEAPQGWQPLGVNYEGKPLLGTPDTAKMVNQYMSQGSPLLQKTADFVSRSKQTILSAGVPKTGWNFHTGVNVPVRAAAARRNPFGALVDSVIWNTNPKSAADYVEKVVPRDITDGLLKGGLNISRSEEGGGYLFKPKEATKGIAGLQSGFDKLFSEAAFDKVLPAHKLKVAWETFNDALKNGATRDEAFKIGAQTANTVFGGVSPADMVGSKDFQNVMRTLLLAPDWLGSNIKIAGKLGGLMNPKNWNNPAYAPFKRFAVNAASMYGTFAMTNKALSGHWPWENGAGQEFNLATGSFDSRGRERMIPAFGTAFDFIRAPLSIVSSIASNDVQGAVNVLKNRLSPPVNAGISVLTNQDYRGREITSPDKSVTDNIAGLLGQAGNAVGVPSQITNTLTFLRGGSTPEELMANLLEAPLRFRGGAKTPSQIDTADLLKQGGATNEQIAQAFSKNPSSGGSGGGLGDLFGLGKKNYSTLGMNAEGKVVMPKTKKEQEAFNKTVDNALSSGTTDLPDSAIIIRFFDGKTYDKSARSGQRDILDQMLKVAQDQYLTPEQKTKIANAAKIDPLDLQYYKTASMNQNDRLEGLLSYARNADPNKRDELISNLILGKKEVGGKSMFSTSMFDRLYDEGIISKDEKALIAAVKYDPIYNKFYMDRDYKGSGGLTPAKIKSYVTSVNSLFKKTIKTKSEGDKTIQALSEAPKAPTLDFGRKSSSKSSSGHWFNAY